MNAFTFLLQYKRRLLVGCVALLATSGFALSIPWVMGRIIDALQGDDPGRLVTPLALALVGLAVAQAITRIASRIAIFNAARNAEYDLRSALFAHLLTLEPAFYRARRTGDILSRLTNDVNTLRALWGAGVLNLINTLFVFAVGLVLMLRLDPWLTLWALLPYPCMVGFGILFGRMIIGTVRALNLQVGALSAVAQEDLVGVGVIKAYGLERARHEKFVGASKALLDRAVMTAWIRGLLPPVLTTMASIGTVIAIWVGGRAVIDGRMGLGDLIQFNGYLVLLVLPTTAVGFSIGLLQMGRASWQRVSELLDSRPTITDGAGPPLDRSTVAGAVSIRNLTIEIEGRKLLDQVSLEIPAGQMTAIVGRVGCGKSTLVEAVPRLLDVPRGSVFLDGRDITDLPLGDLRSCIGYAPQEAFLFSMTIAENIAFGFGPDGNSQRSDNAARIARAASAAGLTRDLAALPDHADTVVGEHGITLSGGQRQRVALARAIGSDPRVLILDDSLSAVDAETEREILEHMSEVTAGRTSIVISHRVAAVRRANQIAVLDGGRLVQLGTHDELIAAPGVYADLYQAQIQDERAS